MWVYLNVLINTFTWRTLSLSVIYIINANKNLRQCDVIVTLSLDIYQFRPPIALRTDLSRITTELWEIPVLRMAH